MHPNELPSEDMPKTIKRDTGKLDVVETKRSSPPDFCRGGLANGNSLIPIIAGEFADPVTKIWAGGRIHEYIAAADGRRHLWHAWLSSERVKFCANNAMSAELAYHQLTFASSKDLILQAFGERVRGYSNVLGKLGATPRSPRIYRALARTLLNEGAAAKFVRHATEPSDEMILSIVALPPALAARPVLNLLKGGLVAPEAIGFVTWALRRLESLQGTKVTGPLLKAANPVEAIWEVILSFPFPAPPWEASGSLVPIDTLVGLDEIARKFNNCLGHETMRRKTVLSILNGVRYFYEWRGEEPAVLEFGKLGQVGWCLLQTRGERNHYVAEETRFGILAACANFPMVCATDGLGSHHWADDGTWVAAVF
ncbi:hypothetical protein [Devosia sp. 919]|uniref:hypothetical protein n=1 Tax=Devosia sp. 919 TaxID=2726065 RepID=UPI00155493A7|nr:hypothetical protein [Devosia sp. 919]